MIGFDIAESMRPKLTAIEEAIARDYETIKRCARTAVETAISLGSSLKEAKKMIVPQQWTRWCNTALPFGARWARILMKLCADYEALPEPNQSRLLESATSVQSALRILKPEPKVGAEVTSSPRQENTTRGPENGGFPSANAQTNSQERQSNFKSNAVEPDPDDAAMPDPAPRSPEDPWQEVKQEAAMVYGNVTRALTALKEAVEDARGYGVFSFVGSIEQDIRNASVAVKLAKPTEICKACQPFKPGMSDQCMVCHRIGMVPKFVNDKGL